MGKVLSKIRNNTARPVYVSVRGAPFQIGHVVRVCQLIDEEAEAAVLGKHGIVEYLEYSCGCGQSYPRDPMIGVRFPGGELHEFWREELQRLKPRPTKLLAARSK